MTLFEDEPARPVRSGADWEVHRRHRHAPSGPPQDELGVPSQSSFLIVRTAEVVVAVRGITSYSDGLLLVVVVLFADEQRAEDLDHTMDDFSRSPGRFRFGCVGADGRAATSGTRDAPAVEPEGRNGPALLLLRATGGPLLWTGEYWLHPLPAPGPLVLGCRWPDRRVPETLVEVDTGPLLAAAARSAPVWGPPTGVLRP